MSMGGLPRMGPVRTVRTDLLEVGYVESGPPGGQVVLLLHGFPYDVHSYVDVAPRLADAGFRGVVPYLRGHGPTRFLDATTPRSGQQAALGADVVALLDALGIDRALLAGYDWGGRAACVVAALWPERCSGLLSVNGHNMLDAARSMQPASPETELRLWYQFYFHSERGVAGLTQKRKELTRLIWARNSPAWTFGDDVLDRAAE